MNENQINNHVEGPRDGLTFNWLNLLLGVAFFLWFTEGSDILSDDWNVYLCLAIVVVIHELGHVIVGKSFGCFVKEMQVFFLSFVSYKPRKVEGGSSWRDIRWSLGVLPLGGVTVFKSRESGVRTSPSVESDTSSSAHFSSPYIEDKPAWQRLLISAGGVLFNIATFVILYFSLPFISFEYDDFIRQLTTMSLLIALLNMLPVYPLDGGSIVFSLYEIMSGKKPSPSFTRVCGWIGFIFIVLFFWVFPEWLGGIMRSVYGLFF